MQIITVSQLNKYIKTLLDYDELLNNVYIKGELSNFKLHYASGHCYMTLKDEGGVVKAVMFRSAASKLKFTPENGMKVIVNARVSVYERDGVYQLYINEMQPDGIGALHIRYNQLKDQLDKEGLFDERLKNRHYNFPDRCGDSGYSECYFPPLSHMPSLHFSRSGTGRRSKIYDCGRAFVL